MEYIGRIWLMIICFYFDFVIFDVIWCDVLVFGFMVVVGIVVEFCIVV